MTKNVVWHTNRQFGKVLVVLCWTSTNWAKDGAIMQYGIWFDIRVF